MAVALRRVAVSTPAKACLLGIVILDLQPAKSGGSLRVESVSTRHVRRISCRTVPFTILHVSDLHRSPEDPISNDELISTLVADIDRAARETPAIAKPNAIVVSGDLVQGVPLDTPEHSAAIAQQYGTAISFLEELTDRLVEGDRSLVAIVPGNHDVDWNVARSAMTPVDPDQVPEGFGPSLCGPLGRMRLDWRKLQAYRINDQATYGRRLAHFDDAISAFYDGVAIERTDLFRLHSWYDGAIGVACFDSCVGNDCFAYYGAIREEAVARAHLALRERGHQLHVAVWHHSVAGDPVAADYMSLAHLYQLIDRGFRIGFHGHQHRAEINSRHAHGLGDERMAVISAGSLCAGRRELPTGTNRQYNVVELSDELTSVRVHVREMAIATNFTAARRAEFGGNSYVDLSWDQPAAATVPSAAASRNARVLEAEAALARGNAERAVDILTGIAAEPDSYARALLLQALREHGDDAKLAEAFDSPANADELVSAAFALLAIRGETEALAYFDDRARTLELPVAQFDDLRKALTTKARLS